MTQRPDLFRAVVCAVPLLDMVRYHLFGSGKTWIPEYGSADDADEFKTLYAYSPYHHVKQRTALPGAADDCRPTRDDRVDPMHARKMAARCIAGGQTAARRSCCASRSTPATAAPTWSSRRSSRSPISSRS